MADSLELRMIKAAARVEALQDVLEALTKYREGDATDGGFDFALTLLEEQLEQERAQRLAIAQELNRRSGGRYA